MPARTCIAVVLAAFGCLTSAVLAADPKAGATKPGIAQQPISRIATEGSPVALSITATGTTAMTYQWYRNGQAVADHSGTSGTTTNVLNIDPVQLVDAGDYSVVVTSSAGWVASEVVAITVTQMVYAVTPLGTTGALVSIPGQVGDVIRVEVSVNFGPWLTNGYATNSSGVARFIDQNTTGGAIRNLRARYDHFQPVFSMPARMAGVPVIRAYGKVGEIWRFERSSNFSQWTTVGSVRNVSGWTTIADTNAGAGPMQFYRLTRP